MRFEGQVYIGETPVNEIKHGDVITYRGKDGGEGVMEIDPITRKVKIPKAFQRFRAEVKNGVVELKIVPSELAVSPIKRKHSHVNKYERIGK